MSIRDALAGCSIDAAARATQGTTEQALASILPFAARISVTWFVACCQLRPPTPSAFLLPRQRVQRAIMAVPAHPLLSMHSFNSYLPVVPYPGTITSSPFQRTWLPIPRTCTERTNGRRQRSRLLLHRLNIPLEKQQQQHDSHGFEILRAPGGGQHHVRPR